MVDSYMFCTSYLPIFKPSLEEEETLFKNISIVRHNLLFIQFQYTVVHFVILSGNRLPAIPSCKLYISEKNNDKWCVYIKKNHIEERELHQ